MDDVGVKLYTFEPSGGIPNHPDWPLVVYRDTVSTGRVSPSDLDNRFRSNQWEGLWRNGVFGYHHYHSNAHEVLGIARGELTVIFGGPDGDQVTCHPGDVAVLPAGTGHKRVRSEGDLLVVGGYPPDHSGYDLLRAGDRDVDQVRAEIRDIDPPETDPVFGDRGPLIEQWSSDP